MRSPERTGCIAAIRTESGHPRHKESMPAHLDTYLVISITSVNGSTAHSQRQIRAWRDRRHADPDQHLCMPNLRRIRIPVHGSPIDDPLWRRWWLSGVIVEHVGIRDGPEPRFRMK